MEMLLFDFGTERAIDDWTPINDVVMGGVSTGRLEATGNDLEIARIGAYVG